MTTLISENLQAGLVVQGLRKSYQKKTIIQDVSLSVKRGEVVALLGPNGSGKTTSLCNSGSDPGGWWESISGWSRYNRTAYVQKSTPRHRVFASRDVYFKGLNVQENIMAILDISKRYS